MLANTHADVTDTRTHNVVEMAASRHSVIDQLRHNHLVAIIMTIIDVLAAPEVVAQFVDAV
jgi:hypothetical protein